MARISQGREDGERVLSVVLSERNLWALVTKLYLPTSACTIQIYDVPPGFASARLRAEPDNVHYASATRGLTQGLAGAMHPVTEMVMALVRPAIADAVAQVTGKERAL